MSSDTGYATLRDVLTEHQPQGWAIEFGVYSGASLKIIAEHMPVIGLDSFDGLPEDWRPGFPKGKFALPFGGPQYPYHPNAMIVPGLFSDSLPPLIERGLPWLGLVHIDCDLYSSTVTALDAVLPFIGAETFVVFDEFHGYPGHEEHEMKAWEEFIIRNQITYSVVGEGPEEKAFRIEDIGEVLHPDNPLIVASYSTPTFSFEGGGERG